jgi:sulfonate transport system substrate-binding protein
VAETKLPDAVIARQLERTDLSNTATSIAAAKETILAAGLALQKAGVIEANVDAKTNVEQLIDTRFALSAK